MHCYHPCWWGQSRRYHQQTFFFELSDLQSDVYSVNRNGDNTVPWGAPVGPTWENNIRNTRLTNFNVGPTAIGWLDTLVSNESVHMGHFFLYNFWTRICGWMVLNAEEKSKKITLAELPDLVRSRWEYRSSSSIITPFTLALLIRSETGFAPMRAFTLHQLIRINDLIRIKLNHLLEVVSHRFSLLRVLIASVDATGTRIKAEQIWRNQCQMLHSYVRCRMPGAFPLQKQCSVVNKILL